jgi:hypothetical protein
MASKDRKMKLNSVRFLYIQSGWEVSRHYITVEAHDTYGVRERLEFSPVETPLRAGADT